MTDSANLLVTTLFSENLALVYLLGMCTLLSLTRRVETAVGLGIAVIAVQTVTVPLNMFLANHLFQPGALTWARLPAEDLSYLRLIAMIGVIAASVQLLELVLDRFFPHLHDAMGVYLPLLTVNCAILGGSLFAFQDQLGVLEGVAFGFGTGVGWASAAIILAGLRERIARADMPGSLQGVAAAFILTGFLSLAFSGLSGIAL